MHMVLVQSLLVNELIRKQDFQSWHVKMCLFQVHLWEEEISESSPRLAGLWWRWPWTGWSDRWSQRMMLMIEMTTMKHFWLSGDRRPDWESALSKADGESHGWNIHVSFHQSLAWMCKESWELLWLWDNHPLSETRIITHLCFFFSLLPWYSIWLGSLTITIHLFIGLRPQWESMARKTMCQSRWTSWPWRSRWRQSSPPRRRQSTKARSVLFQLVNYDLEYNFDLSQVEKTTEGFVRGTGGAPGQSFSAKSVAGELSNQSLISETVSCVTETVSNVYICACAWQILTQTNLLRGWMPSWTTSLAREENPCYDRWRRAASSRSTRRSSRSTTSLSKPGKR